MKLSKNIRQFLSTCGITSLNYRYHSNWPAISGKLLKMSTLGYPSATAAYLSKYYLTNLIETTGQGPVPTSVGYSVNFTVKKITLTTSLTVELMGNEKSALSGLEIDEKAIEVTDFWLHHSASTSGANSQCLSVFISEPSLHSSANFGKPSPLERTAKVTICHFFILKKLLSFFITGLFCSKRGKMIVVVFSS